MIKIRTALAALAASAALTFSGAAAAQDEPWPAPEELAAAFKAICVDHAGDLAAQAKAAQAAPWNMKPGKSSDERTTYYDSFPWQVALTTTSEGLNICAVTTGQSGSITEADASRATIKVLAPRPGDIEPVEDGFYWEQAIGGRTYTVMYQGKAYGPASASMMIASYGLSWK